MPKDAPLAKAQSPLPDSLPDNTGASADENMRTLAGRQTPSGSLRLPDLVDRLTIQWLKNEPSTHAVVTLHAGRRLPPCQDTEHCSGKPS